MRLVCCGFAHCEHFQNSLIIYTSIKINDVEFSRHRFFCCVIMSFIIDLSEDFESVILNFELELLN